MQEGKNRYYNHGIVNDVTMLEESINLSLENSSIFFTIFFRKCFSYYLNKHLSKKSHSLKASAALFWIILGLILLEFLYFLRAVRPCLKTICKDVVCITPMLTARIFIFTTSPLLEIILGYFLVSCLVFFLCLLKTVSFVMKFCLYVFDSTRMAVRLKDFIGGVALYLGLF